MTWIDDIKKRLESATPGPWIADHAVDQEGYETRAIYHYPQPAHCLEVIEVPDHPTGECIQSKFDWQLIAHAPTDIANLLEERAVLREALKLAETKFDRYSKEAFWLNIVEAKYPARKPMERCRNWMTEALAWEPKSPKVGTDEGSDV